MKNNKETKNKLSRARIDKACNKERVSKYSPEQKVELLRKGVDIMYGTGKKYDSVDEFVLDTMPKNIQEKYFELIIQDARNYGLLVGALLGLRHQVSKELRERIEFILKEVREIK